MEIQKILRNLNFISINVFQIFILIIIFNIIAHLIPNSIIKEINDFIYSQNELETKNFKTEPKIKSNIQINNHSKNFNIFFEKLITEFEIYILPSTYFIIIILPHSQQLHNQGYLFYKENFQIKQKLIVEYNNLKDELSQFRESFNKLKLTYCENEDYNKIINEIFKLNNKKTNRKKKKNKILSLKFIIKIIILKKII